MGDKKQLKIVRKRAEFEGQFSIHQLSSKHNSVTTLPFHYKKHKNPTIENN